MHAMRHSFRSWMDATGAAPTIQQKGMRHSSLAITMQYGDADRNLLEQAVDKVSALALAKGENGRAGCKVLKTRSSTKVTCPERCAEVTLLWITAVH